MSLDLLKKHFVALASVPRDQPKWIIPNLIVPGFNVIAADPKSYKTLLFLHIMAAIVHGKPVGDPKHGRVSALKNGSVLYIPAEQSARRLRSKYETDVLKRELKDKHDFDLSVARDPFYWKLDDEERNAELCELIVQYKPTILGLDPYYYFHNIEEKSAEFVKPILPLRKAMLTYGGALVVVHHTNKVITKGGVSGDKGFNRIRGHSALWAAADGGMMLRRTTSGAVSIECEYKDFEGLPWTWKPYGNRPSELGKSLNRPKTSFGYTPPTFGSRA